MEAHDANYVGGDINGGVADLRQFFGRPRSRCTRGPRRCRASTSARRRRRRAAACTACAVGTRPGWRCTATAEPATPTVRRRLAPRFDARPLLRDPAADPRPVPGALSTIEGTADRAEPVGHVDEPVAGARRVGRVEAGAVVGHLEAQLVVGRTHRDGDARTLARIFPAFCIASRQQKYTAASTSES